MKEGTQKKNWLTSLGGISLVMMGGLACMQSCKTEDVPEKPNIVFVLVDDMGWKDPGFMGSDFHETPHIDQLASEGIVFTNAYANAPNCAPSRACLLSGQYVPRHGVFTVNSAERGSAKKRKLIPPKNKTELNGKVITLAEALKQQGYSTCHIGKWHMGDGKETSPEAQGFDVNIAGDHSGHPKSYFGPFNMKNLKTDIPKEYLTDRLTDEAVKYIKAHKKEPFFLYFSHYSVHTPLQAKDSLIKKYEQKAAGQLHHHPTYAAMVESTDQSVGRVLEELEKQGIADNTIVVFFSDNGGFGPATSMAPLRGSKGMMYEGGIREPMIVRWPKKIKNAGRCDVPVIGTDFYPTFLEVAGAQESSQILDGKSLLPLLLDPNASLNRESLIWHFPAYLQNYQGMKNSSDYWRTTPASAIRKGDWKLIEYFEDGKLELYNLDKDIGESRNLADTYPEKLQELFSDLKAWRADYNAQIPFEKNPLYEE
jgi:arylsulfatase A-like enzyme